MQKFKQDKFHVFMKTRPGYFALCKMAMNLIDDTFYTSDYASFTKTVANLKGISPILIKIEHKKRFGEERKDLLDKMIASAEYQSERAMVILDEGFHGLRCHAFISYWASLEAGIDNLLIGIIRSKEITFQRAAGLLDDKRLRKIGLQKYEANLGRDEIKKMVDYIKMKYQNDFPRNSIAQIIELLKAFEFIFHVDENTYNDFNEANGVRNILLHEYGYVSEKYSKEYSGLSDLVDSYFEMTEERYQRYRRSISKIIEGLAASYSKSKYSD